MTGVLVVDANLMLLLVVGAASRDYIGKHKRLEGYTVEDFELLGLLAAEFSEIVLLPHILAEVSSLARQIKKSARASDTGLAYSAHSLGYSAIDYAKEFQRR